MSDTQADDGWIIPGWLPARGVVVLKDEPDEAKPVTENRAMRRARRAQQRRTSAKVKS